ncbi:hypothetical protein [Streptomyces sp. NPDC089919]|uniref:hypothetical protein n=1 Tax=Streptomyces sp. NPDC089919 TaxID=3155188 RepID=UPI00343A319C
MARSSSGIVAGLTAAAVAAVGFLAFQAQASAPAMRAATPERSVSPSAPAAIGPGTGKKDSTAVPAKSGTGVRVVYSVAGKRVWLVAEAGSTQTFVVMPSTVHPTPGTYSVTSRSGQVKGSDGVPIEHVVRFTGVNGVAVGFSARVDGKMPQPDTSKKTGGIRMSRAGADAMWAFATIGSKIVVVD